MNGFGIDEVMWMIFCLIDVDKLINDEVLGINMFVWGMYVMVRI